MWETAIGPWNLLEVAFGDEALSQSAMFEWYKPFKSDLESWEEGCSAGCLILSLTDDKISVLSAFVHSDWQ